MTDTQGATLSAALGAARSALLEAGVEDAALDARLIVEHFTGTTRAQAISAPERIISDEVVSEIRQAVIRRISGEPVFRILGFREFYGLRFALSPETLEPRPDTETLVDTLLPVVRDASAHGAQCRILDLGTGTGAIALTLLSLVEDATATGVDISAGALATAWTNAVALGVESRFAVLESDWFAKVSGKFRVIAANPPYICSRQLTTLQAEVRNFDPARALDGGADGLDAYRTIAEQAGEYLEDRGLVAVEIGHGQRDEVTALFEAAGYRSAEVRKDIAGRDRVLVFHR